MAKLKVKGTDKVFEVEDPNNLTPAEHKAIMDAFGIDKGLAPDEQYQQYQEGLQKEEQTNLSEAAEEQMKWIAGIEKLDPEAKTAYEKMLKKIDAPFKSAEWMRQAEKILQDAVYRQEQIRDPLGTWGRKIQFGDYDSILGWDFPSKVEGGKLKLHGTLGFPKWAKPWLPEGMREWRTGDIIPDPPISRAFPLQRDEWGAIGSLAGPTVALGIDAVTKIPGATMTPQGKMVGAAGLGAKTILKYAGADALGWAAGTHTHDLVNEIWRHLAGMPEYNPNHRYLHEYADILSWTGGSYAMLPLYNKFMKPMARKIFGIESRSAQDMVNLSDLYGLDLGIIHVSKQPWVKGVKPVIGIFPYVGKPFSQIESVAQEQIRKTYRDNIGAFAPLQTFTDLGADMVTLAGKDYNAYMKMAKVLYDDFFLTADKLGNIPIINLKKTKAFADEIFKKGDLSIIKGSNGEAIRFPGTQSEQLFHEFYRQLGTAPDITARQAKKLKETLNAAIGSWTSEGGSPISKADMSSIRKLARFLESDIMALNGVPKNSTPETKKMIKGIKEKFHTANDFVTRIAPTYEGPLKAQLSMAQMEIFGEGITKQGFLYNDEVMELMLKRATKSHDFMRDYMALMTPPAGIRKKLQQETGEKLDPDHFRKRFLQKWFDQAFSESLTGLKGSRTVGDYKVLKDVDKKTLRKYGWWGNNLERSRFKDVVFDYDKFSRQIGLNSEEGRLILDEALGEKGAWKNVQNFVDAVDNSWLGKPVDASQFVKRRLTLGGAKALLGGVAIGTALTATTGPVGAIITAMCVRGFNEFLTDPIALKNMINVLEDPIMTRQKKAFLLKFAGRIFKKTEEVDDEKRVYEFNKALIDVATQDEDYSSAGETGQVEPEKHWKFIEDLKSGIGSAKDFMGGGTRTIELPEQKLPTLQGSGDVSSIPKASYDTTIEQTLGPVAGSSLANMNMASLGGGNNALAPNTRSALAFGGTDLAMAQQRANKNTPPRRAAEGGIMGALGG